MTTTICFMVPLSLVAPGFFFLDLWLHISKKKTLKNPQNGTKLCGCVNAVLNGGSADFGRFLYEVAPG